VLSSVVGAYYYLRIIKIMWFDEPAEAFVPMAGELKLVLAASGLFVGLFYLFAGTLVNATSTAAASLF
jgi:NADH-quinone oxidoreductase subunit N